MPLPRAGLRRTLLVLALLLFAVLLLFDLSRGDGSVVRGVLGGDARDPLLDVEGAVERIREGP